MTPPSVILVTPDELRALVREEVRAALAEVSPGSTSPAPLVDKREAARTLGVSSATLDRLVAAGRIPFVRVGDHRRFDLAAVRASLEAVPAGAPAKPAKLQGVRLLSRRAG